MATFTISCDDCIMRDTEACDDCVVTFLAIAPSAALSSSTSKRRAPSGSWARPAWSLRCGTPLVDCPPAGTVPTVRELTARVLEVGREAGLDAVGVAPAEPFARARQALEQRKPRGLHGGMAFTYRNPARSTDPVPRSPVRGRSSSGPARYAAATHRSRSPDRGGRSLRARDHYTALRDGLARLPPGSRRRAGRRGSSPTTTRSSTARPRTGPGSAGSARTPTCCCPAGARGSCSARSSPTRRSTCRRAGRRRLRLVPPVHRRLPDRRDRRARGRRRPSLPGVARAGAGRVPARAPRRARRPALRLRRLPGGVPAEPRPTGAPTTPTTTRCRHVGRRPRPARRATRRCSPPRPLVHPRARPATCAATRWSSSATSATAESPRSRRRCAPTSRIPTTCCAPMRWAGSELGRADLLALVADEPSPLVHAEL